MPDSIFAPGISDPFAFPVYPECKDFVYVLDRYRLSSEFLHNAMGAAARARTALSASLDWRRIFLADAVTGIPGTFAQLFRAPLKNFESWKSVLSSNAEYNGFVQKLAPNSFERFILCPLPYSPKVDTAMDDVMRSFSESHDTPETVILTDQFLVVPGKLPELISAKESFFVPTVTQKHGWALIAAGTRADVADCVMQLWALPDSNRLIHTMRAMSQQSEYRTRILPAITIETQDLSEPRAGE